MVPVEEDIPLDRPHLQQEPHWALLAMGLPMMRSEDRRVPAREPIRCGTARQVPQEAVSSCLLRGNPVRNHCHRLLAVEDRAVRAGNDMEHVYVARPLLCHAGSEGSSTEPVV